MCSAQMLVPTVEKILKGQHWKITYFYVTNLCIDNKRDLLEVTRGFQILHYLLISFVHWICCLCQLVQGECDDVKENDDLGTEVIPER